MLEVISLEAGVPVTPAETSPLTQLKRSPLEDETLSSTYTVGKATTELEVIPCGRCVSYACCDLALDSTKLEVIWRMSH